MIGRDTTCALKAICCYDISRDVWIVRDGRNDFLPFAGEGNLAAGNLCYWCITVADMWQESILFLFSNMIKFRVHMLL